jgi:hypothetical protein
MLPLVSTSRPTAKSSRARGTSSPGLNRVTFWGRPSSKIRKSSRPSPRTHSPRRSDTTTVTLTASTAAGNTGDSPAGDWLADNANSR